MNIKPAWDTKPDMFEGSISNITPQTQQSPLEEVGNGASHSIIEALEEHTVPLFNNNPLHGAMAEMVGGCPVEIRRSVIGLYIISPTLFPSLYKLFQTQ